MKNYTTFLCLDGVHSSTIRKASAKFYHALGQPNLPQLLIILFSRMVISRFWVGRFALPTSISSLGRRIIDDLILQSFVCCSQRRIVDGQESQLGGNYLFRRLCGNRHRIFEMRTTRSRTTKQRGDASAQASLPVPWGHGLMVTVLTVDPSGRKSS